MSFAGRPFKSLFLSRTRDFALSSLFFSTTREPDFSRGSHVLHFLFFSPNRVDSILSISDTNFVQSMYLVLTFASRRVQIQIYE